MDQRFSRLIPLAAAIFLGGACKDPAQPERVYDPTGVAYRLMTINGAALPFTFVSSQQTTISAGQLCLFTDGQYHSVVASQAAAGPGRADGSDTYGNYALVGTSGTVGSAPATTNAARDTVEVTYENPAQKWVYVADAGLKTTVCLR